MTYQCFHQCLQPIKVTQNPAILFPLFKRRFGGYSLMERNLPVPVNICFSIALQPRNIFSMSNWNCWPDYVSTVFLHVNNIEWCQLKVITIHSFIYEKVQFNSILTAVSGQLWMGWVELDWYISPPFMIYDFGAVINQTYWVWQLLIWGNLAHHHWLEWSHTILHWLMILFFTLKNSFTNISAV